jgi:putative transposase
MLVLASLFALLRDLVRSRRQLVLENLALRQQLGVLRRSVKRPRLRNTDRLFWVLYSRLVQGWRGSLHVLSPDTVIQWHRRGWRAYWRFKSRHKLGRPTISRKLMHLIWRLQRENRTWGEKRITAELALLGHHVGSSTVGRYMRRARRPNSGQAWKTFLRNNAKGIAACDFFLVPTVTFRKLYAFVVLEHDRRRIRHVAVTTRPGAAWVTAQIEAAYPVPEGRPTHLIHDRQRCFMAETFKARLADLAIEDRRTAPRQCWQNSLCERVIGTLRRECTDHLLVWNARHLKRLLREYAAYYNSERPHLSLDCNAPLPRAPAERPAAEIRAIPVLGGLHHRYRPAA